MYKKISIILLLLVLVTAVSFAQEKVLQKKPILVDQPVSLKPESINIGNGSLAAAYVSVDIMANAYGPSIETLNPVAYDPFADVVAVLHRGTAALGGSGTLYYNYSTDGGVNWTRTPTAINDGLAYSARYPSMAILNGSHSTDIGDLSAVASWPQLTPADFGNMGYAIDQPFGGAAPYSALIVPKSTEEPYSSQVPCWASDNSLYFFWASDYYNVSDYIVYNTEDFSTINNSFWDGASNFADGFMLGMGGVSFNGTDYMGLNSTFNFDNGFWVWPGYVKSTDNGATWSNWNICNFTQIPVLADYDVLFDNYSPALDAYVSYSGDIQVDKNGYVHMIVGVSDTADTWETTTKNAIVELYEDPSAVSGWNAKIILEGGIEATDWDWMGLLYDSTPNIGQMGFSGYLAFDVDREILVAQWVNTGNIEGDTLAVMDIFYSYRNLDGEWAAPINITNTTNINESGSHLAPTMKKESVSGGYDVTFYSMYWYEEGNTTPITNSVNPSEIFIAPITQFVPITGVEEEGIKLNSFSLDQNYPNPFNPSTVVNYTLAKRSNVTLKVYDVLGKEVANLVNNSQEAGTHQVTFDASNLASGLYIYTLNAGDFSSSKKMMLMK